MAEPFDELWVIDSSNNEGTNSLVNGRIRQERMIHRAYTTSTKKLAMAGIIYEWCRRYPPFSVC